MEWPRAKSSKTVVSLSVSEVSLRFFSSRFAMTLGDGIGWKAVVFQEVCPDRFTAQSAHYAFAASLGQGLPKRDRQEEGSICRSRFLCGLLAWTAKPSSAAAMNWIA